MFFKRYRDWFSPEAEGSMRKQLTSILGARPKSLELYHLAFLHASMMKTDESGTPLSNERLEFLGDSVLGAVVANYLYEQFPDKDEGYLTAMKSKMVSRRQLNKVAIALGLHQLLESKVQEESRSKSLYGDALEALIGALFLDLGHNKTERFIRQGIIAKHLDWDKLTSELASYKSALIEWGQKNRKEIRFEHLEPKGLAHKKEFEVEVYIDDMLRGGGKGSSKKRAEEHAARLVWENLL